MENYELEDNICNNIKINNKHNKNNYKTNNSSHFYEFNKKQFLKRKINFDRSHKMLMYECQNYDYDDDTERTTLNSLSDGFNKLHKLKRKLYKRSGWKHIPDYYYKMYGIKKIKTFS